MIIRRFTKEDAQAVSDLIIRTLRITNVKDYSPDDMEELARRMQPADILQRAFWTHMYVACNANGGVIGCGAIGPYWGKEDESSLFSIFVDPDLQGQGVGRAIVQALEADEFGKRARRIEIPASITAVGFYRKLGYAPKPGHEQPDEEQLYRMEKFPGVRS